MISNTRLFYTRMKQFQDKRREIEEAYEKSLKDIERFQGSSGYEEDRKRLQDKHETDLTVLRDEYRSGFHTILGAMMDNIGKRPISPPTTEQLNLLSVLKMKRKITVEELDRSAETLKNNPLALEILTEIAREQGQMRGYNHLCPEMSSQTASELVTDMKTFVEDFMMHDTTKASRIAYRYYSEHYGVSSPDAIPLTKRRLFTDQVDFYREVWGLEGEELKQFSEIVDGGSEDD